jgi:hypothetical protein
MFSSPDLSTTPSVSTRRATGAARALLTKVDSATAPRLAVYAHGTPRLVWEVVATGAKDGDPRVTKEGCELPAPQAVHPKR